MQLFIEIVYLHKVKEKYFLLVFLLVFFASFSQEKQENDFKVGLVLSGGGAKGMAHIGVLKAIEEAGVSIDYIGGTSMGAIVGALYASGYSAQQLDSLFRNTDIENIVQDELPRSAKTFYEKKNSERYALTLPFDGFKIAIPSAISKGQNVYNMLSRMLFHVSDVEDFSKLPIPFLCMATNIETGEAVILNKGHLVNSISASGAFPSLFDPVEIDGKLLIDGGVVNNYPIDEIRNLGADFIIGVDVQDDLDTRETLNTATSILLQINNYRTVKDMRLKEKKTDLYIKPDITKYTVVSFDRVDSIIKKGYEAGTKIRGRLDSLSQAQKIKNEKPKVHPPFPEDEFLLKRLVLEGERGYSRAYIRGKLRYSLGKKITFQKFSQGINNLAGTNNFDKIFYEFDKDLNGGENIVMNLKENKNETFLRLGIHYDDLYKTAGLINITKKKLLFNDDILSFDLILGDRIRYNLDYYLDKGFYWSFGIKSFYNSFKIGVKSDLIADEFPELENISTISLEVEDLTNQIYLQTLYREEFTLGAGLEHKLLTMDTETVSEQDEDVKLTFENSNYMSTYGYVILDTYDNIYFPSRGIYFNGDFHFYFYSSDYSNEFEEFSIGKAKLGVATPLFNNVTFNFVTEGGFKIGKNNLKFLDFALGGYGNYLINNFIPFYGYDYLSFNANSYVKTRLTADWEFAKNHHVNFSANYANAGDYIFSGTKGWLSSPEYSGYAIGYGLESFLGPIELKYTWSPENKDNILFVNVGFWF
ncbi:patatin-like phospholipase family protein [Abyssalbus ytuae]|uniref:Patatin-like phospholipase family protein n=1 Tax=Abyssalbus ytuae TaxID=2926907 RepID=A0A9E6ZWN9_9FLAO|nr:patatin-like phospholipase family protein [Abyssalbus ytuae]UOB19138.1 patatin-like phospholipase family protein [Abyssalbus ytuae]